MPRSTVMVRRSTAPKLIPLKDLSLNQKLHILKLLHSGKTAKAIIKRYRLCKSTIEAIQAQKYEVLGEVYRKHRRVFGIDNSEEPTKDELDQILKENQVTFRELVEVTPFVNGSLANHELSSQVEQETYECELDGDGDLEKKPTVENETTSQDSGSRTGVQTGAFDRLKTIMAPSHSMIKMALEIARDALCTTTDENAQNSTNAAGQSAQGSSSSDEDGERKVAGLKGVMKKSQTLRFALGFIEDILKYQTENPGHFSDEDISWVARARTSLKRKEAEETIKDMEEFFAELYTS